MNFFHHFYPSLLKVPGFLLEFITPIVKATKGTRVRFFVLSYVVSGLSFEVDDEKNSSSSKFSFLNSKKNRSSPSTPCLSTKPGGRSAAGPPGGRSSTTKVIFGLFLFSLAEKSEERVDKREEGKKLTQGPETKSRKISRSRYLDREGGQGLLLPHRQPPQAVRLARRRGGRRRARARLLQKEDRGAQGVAGSGGARDFPGPVAAGNRLLGLCAQGAGAVLEGGPGAVSVLLCFLGRWGEKEGKRF